eukprot:COSAG06_NODE_18240_length_896_cov_2.814304_1_plen_121_part_10
MLARGLARRLSIATAAPCRHASSLVVAEHSAGALAAGTYHAIGAASQLGGDVRESPCLLREPAASLYPSPPHPCPRRSCHSLFLRLGAAAYMYPTLLVPLALSTPCRSRSWPRAPQRSAMH